MACLFFHELAHYLKRLFKRRGLRKGEKRNLRIERKDSFAFFLGESIESLLPTASALQTGVDLGNTAISDYLLVVKRWRQPGLLLLLNIVVALHY
jgi:hypothetical protein